jgi:two-component system response regulator RstA
MLEHKTVVSAASILIIEDDDRLAQLTSDYLIGNGYKVTVETNGSRAIEKVLDLQPDLVILDLMLAGDDGLSVCRQLRPLYKGSIIMLTARIDELDQVLGLEMGADDYICKPVQPRLLLARMKAALRRNANCVNPVSTKNFVTTELRYDFGDLVIDSAMREVWLSQDSVELTSAEFDLLWFLASNAGRILSREEIFQALRGIDYDGQDRSIDVRVSRIRAKIGDDSDHPRRIKTVRSRGCLFVRENG